MKIRKTYWIASLSLLLSLSLVLPYCCHADISEVFSHQKELSAHAAHGADSCDCGHEFVKDFQKTNKVASSQAFSLSSAITLQDQLSVSIGSDFVSIPQIQPGVLSDFGPPIHLLNSVFLN